MSKRIAIIGAGASGMTSVKACLEQGLDPVVFEKTNYTGGLWRYQEKQDENGIASIMKSTIINSSKEMSAFSDFPPPAEFPNFMHNTKMVVYFDMYADSFNFTNYVKFHTEVLSVEMADDYEETGRWKLQSRNLITSEMKTEIFDGVMICTGHHGTVNQPTFKGQEKFRGRIFHTHSLKSSRRFEDQSVVVVGIGNSGGDAAVELSVVARQVYLSTRRGSWISHRVSSNGLPLDFYFHRRFVTGIFSFLPLWLSSTLFEWYLNSYFNHELYQLKPKHHVFSQHIMVNDSLPNRILSGTVIVKGDIDYLVEDGVVFKGESTVTHCDVLILATGYKVNFPFLSESILSIHQNRMRLFKHQFIHTLRHPETLCLVGLIQPIGAILPIAELQARWFSLLMAGKLKMPSKERMLQDMAEKDQMQARYYTSERHTVQVDWLDFMEDLATEIGVQPDIWSYLTTDWKLFLALALGPAASYQFRLTGPNQWSGARDAVLSVEKRIRKALRTNATKGRSPHKLSNFNCVQVLFFFFFFAIGAAVVISAIFSGVAVKIFM